MKTIITKEERDGLKSGVNNIMNNLATATSRNIKPVVDGLTFLRKGLGKHLVDAGLKIGSVSAKSTEPSITYHPGGNGDKAEVVQ